MGQRLNGGDGVEETTGDLLDVLLRNDEWKSTMGPATYAFHVTGVRIKQPQPSSSELKFDLLNAPTCPPELVSLLSVTLSFSEWSNQSINNVTLNPGSLKYWCVQTSLARFQDYDIWYYKQPYKGEDCVHQVWLVLTREEERQYMEGLSNVRELGKGEENPFLYFKDGQPRITKDVKKGTIKYSVKFVVREPFFLQPNEKHWYNVAEITIDRARFIDGTIQFLFEKWHAYVQRSHKMTKWEIEDNEKEIVEDDERIWIMRDVSMNNKHFFDLIEQRQMKNIVPAKYAYHVTNVRNKKPQPKFINLVKYFEHYYIHWACYFAFPFFSSTQCSQSDNNGIPTTSPYPLGGTVGEHHWRVRLSLDQFKDYDFWYCNYNQKVNPVREVWLILTKGEDERRYVENIPDIVPLDISKPNPFLYYDKEDKQWYTNDYSDKNSYVVNFIVLHDFTLEEPLWDTVERTHT